MSTITVEQLTKRYGDVLAVDDISFDLEPGTITGFVGANGAGKSTTPRMLLKLTRPSSGRAMIVGHMTILSGFFAPVLGPAATVLFSSAQMRLGWAIGTTAKSHEGAETPAQLLRGQRLPVWNRRG